MWKYFFKNQTVWIFLLLTQSRQTACPQLWLVHVTPVHGQPRQGRPDNLLIKTLTRWTWQFINQKLGKVDLTIYWKFGLKTRPGRAHNWQTNKTFYQTILSKYQQGAPPCWYSAQTISLRQGIKKICYPGVQIYHAVWQIARKLLWGGWLCHHLYCWGEKNQKNAK